jgi:hypothetical protein
MKDTSQNNNDETKMNDTTPKVVGIGGIFFFSDNPEETKEWYTKNLGLETNEWGSSFEFRNANRPDEINYLQWSPFKKGSEYFAPSKKEFMILFKIIYNRCLSSKQNSIKKIDTDNDQQIASRMPRECIL